MKLLLSTLLLLALAIIACQPAAESTDSSVTSTQVDEAAIKLVDRQYVDKWNDTDVDGMLEYVADDVVIMGPEEPASVGKEAMRSSYKQWLAENISTWEVSIENIEISGNLAFVRISGTGSNTPKDGGDTKTNVEKGIHVFRRTLDGSWKMIIEIWNSNE